MKIRKLRLKIELVPNTSWYTSLKRLISKKDWNKIRKEIYAKYGYRCGICGAEGRLNCHEIWEYDYKKHIQKLKGFIALCDMCHFIKHIGLAEILASEGKLDYKRVIEHFMRVNNCDLKTFERHKEMAITIWRKRSQYNWRVDFGEYNNIVCLNLFTFILKKNKDIKRRIRKELKKLGIMNKIIIKYLTK